MVSLSGYCLSAKHPDYTEALASIDGNICRCTGYKSIERALEILVDRLKGKATGNTVDRLVKNAFLPDYFLNIPEKLTRLPELEEFNLKPRLIVGGGTDLYVQRPEEMEYTDLRLVYGQASLKGIRRQGKKCELGAAVTVTDMMESDLLQQAFPNLKSHLRLVSSTPIRNMATLAGNFVNASPIGDMTIFFLALNSTLLLKDEEGSEHILPLKDFYLGYKQLQKRPDEMIYSIQFDLPDESTFFNFEKVSKRTFLDIATVNSAVQYKLDAGSISDIHLSAGGVGPTPKYLVETATFLKGKRITPEILLKANSILQEEISPISDIRGSADYKRLLLRQLFFAHFLEAKTR